MQVASAASYSSAGLDALERLTPVTVDVACPDARQPAYRAVAGLAHSGQLGTFHTAYYHKSTQAGSTVMSSARRAIGTRFERRLRRRRDAAIPDTCVQGHPWVDLAIAVENRIRFSAVRRRVAQIRTDAFDRTLARSVERGRPNALLAFSDVASEHAFPMCRQLGVATVLSVVHGDPDLEIEVLRREAERSPEFFPLYLGDGRLDQRELAWLHARRKREAQLADLLLVPSQPIADALVRRGIHPERVRVVPYAADLVRFHPIQKDVSKHSCTFVFAGGLTQRKGISYLLDAWARVYRPGWRLWLVGALPARLGALAGRLDQPGVRLVGPVPYADMPARLAAADIFVFPSLFEGSAVVTYEALACGLPSISTVESGSVARDRVEGLHVPAADPVALVQAMTKLATDHDLRRAMSIAARARSEEFTWQRYSQSIADAVSTIAARPNSA